MPAPFVEIIADDSGPTLAVAVAIPLSDEEAAALAGGERRLSKSQWVDVMTRLRVAAEQACVKAVGAGVEGI